jgi:hypothetical protein
MGGFLSKRLFWRKKAQKGNPEVMPDGFYNSSLAPTAEERLLADSDDTDASSMDYGGTSHADYDDYLRIGQYLRTRGLDWSYDSD